MTARDRLTDRFGQQGIVLEALDGDDFAAKPLLAAEVAEHWLEHGNVVDVLVADVGQRMGHSKGTSGSLNSIV
jgi:hypothetical protein